MKKKETLLHKLHILFIPCVIAMPYCWELMLRLYGDLRANISYVYVLINTKRPSKAQAARSRNFARTFVARTGFSKEDIC